MIGKTPEGQKYLALAVAATLGHGPGGSHGA